MKLKYLVSFVGTNYGQRQQLIEFLVREKIAVETFGLGWRRHGYVSTKEMVKIFNQSRINLNLTNDSRQLRARIFEVCLCGGFLLTQSAPGLGKLFRVEKEIVVFNSAKEAAAKIKYYLKHERERQVIARAGYLRVKANYTLEIMLSGIFRAIESGELPPIKLEKSLMNWPMKRKRQLRLGLMRLALWLAQNQVVPVKWLGRAGRSFRPTQDIIKKLIY